MTTVKPIIDLRSTLSGVRDQGVRPTCAALAVSAAHEGARPTPNPLSGEYLHWYATGGEIQNGATLHSVSVALKTHGQPAEATCPYVFGVRSPNWLPPEGVEVFKRNSGFGMLNTGVLEMALRNGVCPVLGISVPEAFFNLEPPWIVSGDGKVKLHHAVLGVGLGEYQGKPAILIRNSWGEEWGDDGHAWLDESFLTRHLNVVLVLGSEVP